MALGRTFEEVLQKGLRMIQIGAKGLTNHPFEFDDLNKAVKTPTPKRIFALAEALSKGYSVEKLYKMTGVDPWFLHKIDRIQKLNIAPARHRLRQENIERLSQQTSTESTQ